MRTSTFFVQIESGKLELENKKKFLDYVSQLKGRHKLTLRKFRNTRSNRQNRYYFGVVVKMTHQFLLDAGYEDRFPVPEYVHEMFKSLFLKKQEKIKIKKNGKISFVTVNFNDTTVDMDTLEYEEFVENCRRWVAQNLGLYIPYPQEVYVPNSTKNKKNT